MKSIKKIALSISQKPVALVLFLSVVIALNVLYRYRWRENNWKEVVHSDGCGYYGYLPAIFIYQDLQYRFYLDLKDKYQFGDLSENFLYTHNGKFFNRYFCGTAIAELPFFLLACLASVLFGFDVDGHSFLFHCSINLAALFYAIAGCYFLSRYLLQFFNARIVAISLGAVFLGTNLFNYTVNEPSYSHAYSFGFICLYIFLADRCIRLKTRRSFLFLASCLGMILLIRPSNGIVILFLPFLAGSWNAFTTWLKICFKPKNLIPSALIGIFCIGIQSALYYAQCGAFWVDGYPYEHFNLLDPQIPNVLFSYRAGLFIWSPVLFLSLPGLLVLWNKNRFQFFALTFFMIINLWLISSWWAWHYAGTFGMRPMVDHLGFFVILFCFSLQLVKTVKWKIVFNTIILSLLIVGHIFNYQCIRQIIPHDGMTSEKYWYIFLKTNPRFSFDLDVPYQPEIPRNLKQINEKHFGFSSPASGDILPENYPNFNLDSVFQYSGFGDLDLIHIHPLKIDSTENYYVDIHVKTNYSSVRTSGAIVVLFMQAGQVIHQEEMPVVSPQFLPNTWNPIRFSFKTNRPLHNADDIVLRIRNDNNHKVLFQQMEFTLASF